MKMGDIVKNKDMTGFKGILLTMVPGELPHQRGQLELEFYGKWKVLWFNHPFEDVPCVEEVYSKNIKKYDEATKS